MAALDALRGPDGEVVFADTGDDLIEKWERALANGETPDLTEGFSEEALKKFNERHAKGRRAPVIDEDFGTIAEKVKRQMQPKYAAVGSKEELAMRQRADARRTASVLGQDPPPPRRRGVR